MQINELDMVGFEGISNTHPPSRLVTIDVEDNPTTVRMLRYSIPLKGVLDVSDNENCYYKITQGSFIR